MDFGLAFSYVFKDTDWLKKVALAGLVSLIPIVGQLFLLGWSLEITRRVIRNDPYPLPDLDFGKNLGEGFKAMVVGIVWGLPIILLGIFVGIVSALTGNMNYDTAQTIMAVVGACFSIIAVIYGLLMGFILPAAYANLVVHGNIGAGLKVGDAFGLVKAAPGAYLIVLVGGIVAGFIASLGTIGCGIGIIVTTAYALAMMGHLYGQAYKQAIATRGY